MSIITSLFAIEAIAAVSISEWASTRTRCPFLSQFQRPCQAAITTNMGSGIRTGIDRADVVSGRATLLRAAICVKAYLCAQYLSRVCTSSPFSLVLNCSDRNSDTLTA